MIALTPLGLALALATTPLFPAQAPALRGLDPVELVAGKELAGEPQRAIERDGFRYLFSSDANRARFEAEPELYEIQMGGGCGRMGPLSGRGNPDRFAVHEKRIYVFASDPCRESFLKAPEKHVDRDDPPLEADAKARAGGAELVELALRGLGGAGAVDAARALRVEKSGVRESGGKEYATRDASLWRFPDDLRSETAWDDWVHVTVVVPEDAFAGSKEIETLHREGRKELRRQMGREPLWLLRHRSAPGFEAVSAGVETVGEATAKVLRVRFEGTVTSLYLDPASGRVLRTGWRGRVDSGPNGEVVADHTDFRPVGALVLPHAVELRFDGQRVDHLSGARGAVEVDPEIAEDAFLRAR